MGTRHCVSWPCFGHSCRSPLKKGGWCVPQAPFYARRRSLACVIGVHLPMSSALGVYNYASGNRSRWRLSQATLERGRSVSFPFSGNYGYIRNLRRSLPKGTLHCVLFRGSLWERYANAAMLREKCPKAGLLSHRLEEHHPCSAELGSKRKTLLQASSKLAIID